MIARAAFLLALNLTLVACSGLLGVDFDDAHLGPSGDSGATSEGSPSSSSGGSSGSSSGSGSVTGSSSSSGSGSGAASGSGSGSSSGAGSGSSSGSSGSSGSDTCDPPPGGAACTPGMVACGAASCPVPDNPCCLSLSPQSATCSVIGSSCDGFIVSCDEASDCPGGEICCLDVTSQTTGTQTCQKGPTCPTSKYMDAQICRSNAECAGGSCSSWSCTIEYPHTVIEACQEPAGTYPFVCTAQ